MQRFRFMFAFTIALIFSTVWLVSSGPPAQAAATISGVVELDYTRIGTRDGKDNTDDNLTVQDVMIYVQGPVGDNVDFFSEFMVNPQSADDEVHAAHDQSILIERMYLTTNELLPAHSVKAGLFQLFDGTIKDYHVATGNPLPGDVIFFKNPWAHHDTLHDVFTDIGVSVSGFQGPISYTLAGFNGMGERTPESTDFDDASPTGFFGKLLYSSRALPGLQAGVAYYQAEDTIDSDAVAPVANLVSDEDEYLIGELIYRRPSFKLTGLWLDGTQTRQVASGAFDNEGEGFMVEGLFNVTLKLALVGRYQEVAADDPANMEFFGAGAHHNTGDIEQIEAGLNYQWTPRMTFKASWQGNDESGNDSRADRVLGQIAASF